MKEIQLLCYVIPMGMCSGSHHPPPSLSSTILGTPYRQEPHPTVPAPTYPPPQPLKPRPQTSASSHHSIVCVGSSSARLLSGPAPQHVLYAQTDDTAALARQRQHKEDNVLPRSFINALNNPSQLTVNKGPLQLPHTVNIHSSKPQGAHWHQNIPHLPNRIQSSGRLMCVCFLWSKTFTWKAGAM